MHATAFNKPRPGPAVELCVLQYRRAPARLDPVRLYQQGKEAEAAVAASSSNPKQIRLSVACSFVTQSQIGAISAIASIMRRARFTASSYTFALILPGRRVSKQYCRLRNTQVSSSRIG